MEYTIYKALDNPPSFVGLKGSYIRFAGFGMVGAGFIGLAIGGATNGLVGVLSFAALAAGVYLGVMAFQARFSERERKKWVSSRKIKNVVLVPPSPISRMAARRLSAAEKLVKPHNHAT